MKILITMAGQGSRFIKAGYNIPKHEINVLGLSLFEWSMKTFNNFLDEEFIFVVRQGFFNEKWLREKLSKIKIKKYKIIETKKITKGQASTAFLANDFIDHEDSVLIFNIDTYVRENVILKNDFIKVDGLIHVISAPGDNWSFVKKVNGKVVEISEKKRISDYASIGMYYFNNWKMFVKVYKNYKEDVIKKFRETYIAPFYNYLLKDHNIDIKKINKNKVHFLGNPREVEEFKKNYKS